MGGGGVRGVPALIELLSGGTPRKYHQKLATGTEISLGTPLRTLPVRAMFFVLATQRFITQTAGIEAIAISESVSSDGNNDNYRQ